VIIPALNEAQSVGKVISEIPHWVDQIIVVDNGSTDNTAQVAEQSGAQVVFEPRKGYGAACLTGLASLDETDIVVFLDADYSDYPQQMDQLVAPICESSAELVIGSRALGKRERGALTPQARFGNWLSCLLIKWIWGVEYTDLGPFRAVDKRALDALRMKDKDFGWTVEMQIKAARQGFEIREVPVSYRRRIGKSKISGTLRGVVSAGAKILGTIFIEASTSLFNRDTANKRELLIIFTRYPEPGKSKTRLIPELGAKAAAQLQRRMTERIVATSKEALRQRNLFLQVFYQGGNKTLMEDWLGRDIRFIVQAEGDLGRKLRKAFLGGFQAGMDSVVVVGSDCPGLTSNLIIHAFKALRRHDLTLGPAKDGGYYLIGLSKPCSKLFEDIPWGGPQVLSRTREIAAGQRLSTLLLDPLADVDRPEDLKVWEDEISGRTEAAKLRIREKSWAFMVYGQALAQSEDIANATISVIIPTLNEAQSLPAAVESATKGSDTQVMVSDGGSVDNTVEVAESLGVEVIRAPRGRAAQMNMAANRAKGGILLFLHADTILPDGWDGIVRNSLNKPGNSGGAFRLKWDRVSPGSRLVERLANFRSTTMGMPYGDQAIFTSTALFKRMNGFKDMEVMEDYELVARLRRLGRISVAHKPVITSSRKYHKAGLMFNTLINQAIIVLYELGVSHRFLARLSRLRN
jgi:hypothetical protein